MRTYWLVEKYKNVSLNINKIRLKINIKKTDKNNHSRNINKFIIQFQARGKPWEIFQSG